MADYAAWPERNIRVTALLLDPGNPRIPSSGGTPSQRDLIAELVAHDDVYELARDVANSGYIPVESLIGLVDGEKTLVLEGNRRLAALKLLLSPALAPSADLRRFQTLAGAQRADERVEKVRVLLAPTRAAAAPILLRRHTRDQILRWEPVMQAKFYRGLVSSGVSIADLARSHGIQPSAIRDSLRNDAMYELACSLELPTDVAQVVRDPREFPASVLERFVENPKAREFLGIAVDEEGRVWSKAKPADFRKAYARVVTEIAQRTIDTRALNTVEQADQVLARLSDVTPSKQKRTFSTAELLGQTAKAKPLAGGGAVKKASLPRRSSALVPPGLRCTLKDPRARDIFDELKGLKPDRFPNAHGILLRILLEFGVANYLNKTGTIKPLLDKHRAKGKPHDWAPSLQQMLPVLLADQNLDLEPRARKALAKMTSDQTSLISIATLDAFVHNPYTIPDEAHLRALWAALEGVFKLVLREPPAKPKGARPSTAPSGS